MTDFALKAFEFGVLGLCAVTLILVWNIINKEQKRDGYPRQGIMRACYVFMTFSTVLAVLNTYVQLAESEPDVKYTDKISMLEQELRLKENKLLQIRSAAIPILQARSNIIGLLPDGPESRTLRILIGSLKENLK